MNWLLGLWDRFRCWIKRVPPPLQTVSFEELPDELDAKTVYLVGEGDYLWFAAMICPCGCGATLHMSLLPDGHPRWDLIRHKDGTISLQPSVWRTQGCRSHFFLREGRIVWCSLFSSSE